MRRPPLHLVLAAGAAAALTSAGPARAQQIDVNPVLPNVVFLLDTSGSMELMADGTDPDAAPASACKIRPGFTGDATSVPNRWGSAIQSLTGSIVVPGSNAGFACATMSRKAANPTSTATTLAAEYGVNGKSPYDADYYLPFHRPASGTCVVAPGKLPGLSAALGGAGGNATDYTASGANASITTRDYLTGAAACAFNQLPDGALDGARDIMRVGLMTFDTDPSPSTGATGPAAALATSTAAPFLGTFSYFPGWDTGATTSATGRPTGCPSDLPMEVGARSPAAPPWEGRLVRLPSDPDATVQEVDAVNDQVQLAINAMRPYGATPIAGMLQDAKYYYWGDGTGPQKTDPYVQGNCRDEFIVLLTDGSPNMDLRPACAAAGGTCPYDLPENIAKQLYGDGRSTGTDGSFSGRFVTTYVIGFAVSKVNDDTPVDCDVLAQDPATFNAKCSDPSPATQAAYGPCCTLQKIALAGSGNQQRAFFVKTQQDLSNALGTIVSNIARKTTARTTPAYSPQVADITNDPNSPITNASLYLSSFKPVPGGTWSGNVTRQRYVCDKKQALSTPAAAPGDDFANDLNHGGSGLYPSRAFAAVQPALVGNARDATATIRPFAAAAADGMGTYGGTYVPPTGSSGILGALTPDTLKITATSCPNVFGTKYLGNPAQFPSGPDACKSLALNFAMAQPATSPDPKALDATFAAFVSRSTNAFGDIFHSTPAVVGPPNALVRDDSYQRFATRAGIANRPTVLYTSTNDGLLHAFDTSVPPDSAQMNEIWALMPPAVLPNLLSVYPTGHALLLDGAPIVRDVVFDREQANIGDDTRWHTMLVSGFGSAFPGYYAVEVTDPRRPTQASAGPIFRWQMTSVPSSTKQIFGAHSGTPAITTVFARLNDGKSTSTREIGVAILPGGYDAPPGSGSCPRDADTKDAPLSDQSGAAPKAGYAARTKVRCWGGAGRSVTVVRLDTGEILKTFMRTSDVPAGVPFRPTPLDSPMTGTPVVYPSTVGAVAKKFFIGDVDGTVWRFDISDANPDNWKGELFLDAYNQSADKSTAAYADGQPIAVAPVVALDRNGNLVVEVATGDQETLTASGTNYVYSVTEQISFADSPPVLRATPNWYLRFANAGERVTGPMAVFDAVLYFATYVPATGNVCAKGAPHLYGLDFTQPADATDPSKGGIARLNPLNTSPLPPFYDPVADPNRNPDDFAGKIIPGVTINVTPTCADTSRSTTDPYVSGKATHFFADNVTSSAPSLLAEVGGSSPTGAPLSIKVDLPRPVTATAVDSWASVVE